MARKTPKSRRTDEYSRARQAAAIRGALGGFAGGALIGYVFGRFVIPATDLSASVGGARGGSLFFLWIFAIIGVLAGAKGGEAYFHSQRRERERQHRRERYKDHLERYEKEQAELSGKENDDGYDGDRMKSSKRFAKERGFESPWP